MELANAFCPMQANASPSSNFIALQDPTSELGELVVDVLETCFAMLPRIQLMDVQVGCREMSGGPACLACALVRTLHFAQPSMTALHWLPAMQRAQQLAQVGIPLAERVLLPHILDITKGLYAGLCWGGAARQVCNSNC